MAADTAVIFGLLDLAQIDSRFLLAKKQNMHEITQKILKYTKSKYTLNYNKWYIGLTEDPKTTKNEFETKNKIVCAYFKTWPCKNKTEAKKILKELEPFGITICKKTPNSIIFAFCSIDKENYKVWKILNTQKPKDFLILK